MFLKLFRHIQDLLRFHNRILEIFFTTLGHTTCFLVQFFENKKHDLPNKKVHGGVKTFGFPGILKSRDMNKYLSRTLPYFLVFVKVFR